MGTTSFPGFLHLPLTVLFSRHHNYIQEYTGFREPTFQSSLHDVRLLLLRFAQQKPFHRDAGGGGKLSNMFLLPYMINVAFFYILNSYVYFLFSYSIYLMQLPFGKHCKALE